MLKNYVGVTGVINISDILLTLNSFRAAGFSMDTPHIPMIGFLVIKKTLEGIPPNKGKIPHQRYPPISSLKTVMGYSHESVLNMVHFGAKDDFNLGKNIIALFNKEGIYEENFCSALQLNVAWPRQSELEKILNEFPEMSIVLQLPKKVLNNGTSQDIARKLKDYESLIQGTLIDPSGGKKKELNLDLALEVYQEIKEKNPNIIVGFAGGFDCKNVCERLRKIKEKIVSDDFSIDAEGGVRIYKKDKRGNVMTDMLEPSLVREYLFLAGKEFIFNFRKY